MMGIGVNITDKDISTISQEMNKKATDAIENEG
jgi:hypothetical protein